MSVELGNILLFVGAILVAFQIVGDIGYAATLFSMPFALPIKPLMNKLGINYKKVSPSQLGLQIAYPTRRALDNKIAQAMWWALFILVALIFLIVTLVTQPIMLAYFVIGRPLIGINKLLNWIYKKSLEPWDMIYLVLMQNNIEAMQRLGIKTTKKRYSDKDLLRIREKKGELPFVAFGGLLCIVAGFILQLV